MGQATINIHSRERVAWVFILCGFAIFVCLVLLIPVSINAFLQNATQDLNTMVQASKGTVRIDDGSSVVRAILAGEPTQPVPEKATIATDNAATAFLFVTPPNNEALLARLQIYGDTEVDILEANAPRFSLSAQAQELNLRLTNGRLRLTLPMFAERPFVINMMTPQGIVTIDEAGKYSIEVNEAETQVSVQDGHASVTAVRETLVLQMEQRAVLVAGEGPVGPLSPDRNLIGNGDFVDGQDQWTRFASNVERADQEEPVVRIIRARGETALQVERDGVGHADVRLRQVIDQNVADFESLQLQLTFRILMQSLEVCGIQGSECPLFIRLDYIDENGGSQIWQHGFYAVGEVSETRPDFCAVCAVFQSPHSREPLAQLTSYEVDIRNELAKDGYHPPRFLESISLIISGHSFVVDVVDVALVVQE